MKLSARVVCAWLAASAIVLIATNPTLAGLPLAEPESVGMDAEELTRIDEIVAEGLQQKKMPGCVVCIGRRGKIVLLKAYGQKQVRPSEVPMTTDTVFDLASITKPVATATSVMTSSDASRRHLSHWCSRPAADAGRAATDRATCICMPASEATVASHPSVVPRAKIPTHSSRNSARPDWRSS